MTTKPSDWHIRQQALDVNNSYIVQAPAGAGKTQLLISRYLRLLALVEHPEEILAITFTRKAAAEMGQRVIEALESAGRALRAEEVNSELRQLAERALIQDRHYGWNLINHPGRLRIQTIDSVCAGLVRQMPWSSRLTGTPNISERVGYHYRQAAIATLAHLDIDSKWSVPLSEIMLHLEGHSGRFIKLLSTLLQKRDQWLRHIGDSSALSRQHLEAAWRQVVLHKLSQVSEEFPIGLRQDMLECSLFAAKNLLSNQASTQANSNLVAMYEIEKFPGAEIECLAHWRGIADLLLTQGKKWRNPVSINKRLGFPADKDAISVKRKQTLQSILQTLQHEDSLLQLLSDIKTLPSDTYTDSQWCVLDALLQVLPLAVAELQLGFRAATESDFTEIALAASVALGAIDQPTDLALSLDYCLNHLLIDEFQDTSFTQLDLINRLIAGWQPNDTRTLFLVGDPMQSIYRFREAEVGIFLSVVENGISGIRPRLLQLTCNFRSEAAVVEWLNHSFPTVLPTRADTKLGAVPYTRAVVAKQNNDCLSRPCGGQFHPVFGQSEQAEATRVVEIIQATQSKLGDIAILVRSRTHLHAILPQLRDAGIAYNAIEIENLATRPVVSDLLNLTIALSHRAERIAWLALLRAPWCGLSLAAFTSLFENNDQRAVTEIVWDTITDPVCVAKLDKGDAERLQRVVNTIQLAWKDIRRLPLRRWVESVWLRLGGAAVIDARDLDDAQAYFKLLEMFDKGGAVIDFSGLRDSLQELNSVTQISERNAVQVMTIHKAKGLEFETVILPGLSRTPRNNEQQLIIWSEQIMDGEDRLLVAPIAAADDSKDLMVGYIRNQDNVKLSLESGRLLYVACSRAIRNLHLIAELKLDEDGELVPPSSNSLLQLLWPVLSEQAEHLRQKSSQDTFELSENNSTGSNVVKRLPLAWSPPKLPPDLPSHGTASVASDPLAEIVFDWAGRTARQVGIVVHKLLQQISVIDDLRNNFSFFEEKARLELREAGLSGPAFNTAFNQSVLALRNLLDDARGRWLFDTTHTKVKTEWALSGFVDGQLVNLVLDRSFIDANGCRWIIDFKTSLHAGSDVEVFLNRERMRYQQQLERYATALSAMESQPIKLGLYFPLLMGWREWSFR